jgi:hypothetical protein
MYAVSKYGLFSAELDSVIPHSNASLASILPTLDTGIGMSHATYSRATIEKTDEGLNGFVSAQTAFLPAVRMNHSRSEGEGGVMGHEFSGNVLMVLLDRIPRRTAAAHNGS